MSAPAKVWPGAKWMVPLVFRKRPVSPAELLPDAAKRFSVAFGGAVLLPVTSPSPTHRERGRETKVMHEELKAEKYSLKRGELKDFDEVAVPAGTSCRLLL